MTDKSATPHDNAKKIDESHPGMMGDGRSKQNLDQFGDPAGCVKKADVNATFEKSPSKK